MFKFAGSERILLGFDISDEYTQISYAVLPEKNVETLSTIAGAQNYNIPTVLCKKEGVNQWFFGRDALKYADEENPNLFKNLLSLALNGGTVETEGAQVETVSLLSLFLKRCMGLLAKTVSFDRADAIMVTGKITDERFMEVLRNAFDRAGIKTEKIYFINHEESFYNFMLYQPPELLQGSVMLMEYAGDNIKVNMLKINKHTTPNVVHNDVEEYPFMAYDLRYDGKVSSDGNAIADGGTGSFVTSEMARMDKSFLKICDRYCGDRQINAVYLIGEVFSGGWMNESLRLLCRGRRVFQGSNLFSKGACFGLLEKISPGEMGKSHVFMGNEMLKANIGMNILRQGEEIYFAILDAGINWYEAKEEFDIYLRDGNSVEFIISSLIGKGNKTAHMILDGLKGDISRLHIAMRMRDENNLVIEIEDNGLGEMRTASHRVWREEMEI